MEILTEDQSGDVADRLSEMDVPVTARVFTGDDCQYCDETVTLNEELAELGEKFNVQQYTLSDEAASTTGVDEYGAPATILTREGEESSGVRFYGMPGGQEFSAYLEGILTVSTGQTDVDPSVVERVEAIDEPVDMKVFVTPTCPYCPSAVRVAHDFAIHNDAVTGAMIESQEFMELSREYGVRGVPHVVVNDDVEFKGAQPHEAVIEQVERAL